MISSDYILNHLDRLGLSKAEVSAWSTDEDGDYIKALLPDLDFRRVTEAVMVSKFYRVMLDDSATNMGKYEFRITEWVEGYNTTYKMIIQDEGVGCSISILVKGIDYITDEGNKVTVLGFGMLKQVIDKDNEDAERRMVG